MLARIDVALHSKMFETRLYDAGTLLLLLAGRHHARFKLDVSGSRIGATNGCRLPTKALSLGGCHLIFLRASETDIWLFDEEIGSAAAGRFVIR